MLSLVVVVVIVFDTFVSKYKRSEYDAAVSSLCVGPVHGSPGAGFPAAGAICGSGSSPVPQGGERK